MRLLITGDSGFIGRHLCSGLNRLGHEVYGLSDYNRQMGLHVPRLGDSLLPTLTILQPDGVVHCALSRYDPQGEVNRRGTEGWASECCQAGNVRQIFISSISAELASSQYGRCKADLERVITGFGGVSLRLGLVMGDGGVFATLSHLLQTFHFFPLINGGGTPVFPLFVSFLPDVVDRVFCNFDALRGQVKSLYEPVNLTMKTILARMAKVLHIRYVGLPCPYFMLFVPVWVMEKLLGERAPITRDNLLGLKEGSRPGQLSWLDDVLPQRPDFSDQLCLALKM